MQPKVKHDTARWFADVLLPVPLSKLFTYEISSDLVGACQIGCRVVVPFGKQKIKTGIIGKLHTQPPEKYAAKQLLDVLDTYPIIHQRQIDLYLWMAKYYMCSIGEVINAAIPSGLKLSSESFVQIHPEFDFQTAEDDFSDREIQLLEVLQVADQLSYQEIADVLGLKSIYRVIKDLSDKEAIIIFEQLKEKYKPKKEKWIRVSPKYLEDAKGFEVLFAELEKKKSQVEVLLHYLRVLPVLENPKLNEQGIKKSSFTEAKISQSSLATLIKNNILEEVTRTVFRFAPITNTEASLPLSPLQELKLQEIQQAFQHYDTVLLQGVTGSGKTELYIKLIEEAVEQDQQVLYLLPEIALTTQIVVRLKKVFGDLLGVYHSKYSDNERVEVWLGLLQGRYKVIVGVRSSVFLPFENLALTIVDEEYESTYKQYDPAPRYHARDLAIVMAQMHGAKTLLGTATPSLETFANTRNGKYGHVVIQQRHSEVKMPELILVDLKEQRKRKLMKNEFSNLLVEEISLALERKEQVIIFQNRRGYAPLISCDDCGNIPKCHQCSVSMTYHQFGKELRCHYCGYREPLPHECDACGSTRLRTKGFGTEKIEEDLSLLFPEANIERMDLDTTRSKYSYQRIIEEFEQKRIDILVGTQMVTKGLDFDNVGLVGVVDADKIIHFPDFRAHERAYQLITQVSGRAGRRQKQGKVIIQTYDPSQDVLKFILQQDFESFFKKETDERLSFHYPPHYRIIRVTLRHKDVATVKNAAEHYAAALISELGKKRVLGPQEPLISRIRNFYLQTINIKIEKTGVHLPKLKDVLINSAKTTTRQNAFKQVGIIFDVDPA